MTLERTIRELKEANTIGPNKHQLKVQDFFPKIKNPKVSELIISDFLKVTNNLDGFLTKLFGDLSKGIV